MTSTVLRALDAKVAPAHTAVLVIDLQHDFVSPDGGLARLGVDLTDVQAIVPRVASLLDEARAAGATVIFVCHVNSDDTSSGPIREKRQDLGRERVPVCWQGTPGVEVDRGLSVLAGDLVLRKHRFSAFLNTPLDSMLRAHGIQTLVLMGMSTNVCVDSTARDGFMRDYYVVIPQDCVASSRPELHRPALETLQRYFVTVTSSAAIAQCWQDARRDP